MAMRLAATPARCSIHCVPTSIAGEWAFALADMRHDECLTTVKARTSPVATIQAVAASRTEYFDSASRHDDEAKKLLPMSRSDRRVVKLQTQMQRSDAQPCKN